MSFPYFTPGLFPGKVIHQRVIEGILSVGSVNSDPPYVIH